MLTVEETRKRIDRVAGIRKKIYVYEEAKKKLEKELKESTPKHFWSIRQRRNYDYLQFKVDNSEEAIEDLSLEIKGCINQLLLDTDVFRDSQEMMHPVNPSVSLFRLVAQSLSTSVEYRKAVRDQTGMSGAHSYMQSLHMRYPGGVPAGVTPATPWGEEMAKKAYELKQVQTLDTSLVLLRTLGMKAYTDDESEEYRRMMSFEKGQHVRMGPGLSMSATEPHWLGGGGILLIFEGVSRGVPMVGFTNTECPNENEVFIPDTLHCSVIESRSNGEFMNKKFSLIYRLRVDSSEEPAYR